MKTFATLKMAALLLPDTPSSTNHTQNCVFQKKKFSYVCSIDSKQVKNMFGVKELL